MNKEEIKVNGSAEVAIKEFSETIPNEVTLYTMFYRHGNHPECRKQFYFQGTRQEAVARAQEHCTIMGYRFQYLTNFLSDLALDEKMRREGINR